MGRSNKKKFISQTKSVGKADLSRRQYSVLQADASDYDISVTDLNLLDLPLEILIKIFSYLNYNTIAHLRPVNHQMNRVCGSILNFTFQKLLIQIKSHERAIKAQMPRRPSVRSKHSLAYKLDIIYGLDTYTDILQRKLKKHMEGKHYYFFPGKILDKGYYILNYIKTTSSMPKLLRKEVSEFNDMCTMAEEYVELHIEPNFSKIPSFSDDRKTTSIHQSSNRRKSNKGKLVSKINMARGSRRKISVPQAIARNCDFVSDPPVANLNLMDLPLEILTKILNYLDYNTIAHFRPVSHKMNRICCSILNSTFKKLQLHIKRLSQSLKALMPKRPSARYSHPLSRKLSIIRNLHLHVFWLQTKLDSYIEKEICCFFPGKILDEGYLVLRYIIDTPNLCEPVNVLNEFTDLTTMAIEFFDLYIESNSTEILSLSDYIRIISIRPSSNIRESDREASVSEIDEIGLSRRQYSILQADSRDRDSISDPPVANLNLMDLPFEILAKILNYLDYDTIAHLRPVSHQMNRVCGLILNFTFQKIPVQIKSYHQTVKAQMPKRPSARYNHPLECELEIISALSIDFNMLQTKFHKYIEKKRGYFFPGKILDEVYRILHDVKNIVKSSNKTTISYLNVTKEFQDLCIMAEEYFKLHIESNFS